MDNNSINILIVKKIKYGGILPTNVIYLLISGKSFVIWARVN